jgi:hypothetical protein
MILSAPMERISIIGHSSITKEGYFSFFKMNHKKKISEINHLAIEQKSTRVEE